MEEYTKETKSIRVVLTNGQSITGNVNIAGYERFSDFIEVNKETHIKMYQAIHDGRPYTFLMIPKTNILFYDPESKI